MFIGLPEEIPVAETIFDTDVDLAIRLQHAGDFPEQP